MSTQFTATRLVRDWVSCFHGCRFPVEEEPKRSCSSSTMICYCKNQGHERDDENGQNLIKEEKELNDLEDKVNEDDELRWPSFEEEDYIVFCFEEDGAIHSMKEIKSEPPIRVHRSKASPSSLSVNRKLSYGENVNEVKHSRHEHNPNEEENDYPTNDESNTVKKGKKIIGNHLKKKYIRNNSGESEWKDASAEFSDSSVQSDSTSGSFAFPAVSWEWMGSPVKMPNSEGRQFTKRNSSRCVRLRCCRYLKFR